MISPNSDNITAADVRDIGPIKASFNNTFELGYKGILGNKFRVAIDAWREKRGDVGNPAGLATPNIFFNRTSLQTYMTTALIPAITGALMAPPFSMPQAQAQATANAFAPQIAGTVAELRPRFRWASSRSTARRSPARATSTPPTRRTTRPSR
jgi:iron complex outermembrane receptor protein